MVEYKEIAEGLLEADENSEKFSEVVITDEAVFPGIDMALRKEAGERSIENYKSAALGTLSAITGTTFLYGGIQEVMNSSPELGAFTAAGGLGLAYAGGKGVGNGAVYKHSERTGSIARETNVEYFGNNEAVISYDPEDS